MQHIKMTSTHLMTPPPNMTCLVALRYMLQDSTLSPDPDDTHTKVSGHVMYHVEVESVESFGSVECDETIMMVLVLWNCREEHFILIIERGGREGGREGGRREGEGKEREGGRGREECVKCIQVCA